MKLSLVTSLIFSAGLLTSQVMAAEGDELLPCNQRSSAYCQLPNIGENCNIGTCNSSLSADGDCTIEAIYNEDRSSVVSCSVCSTTSISAEGCQTLGGTLRRAS